MLCTIKRDTEAGGLPMQLDAQNFALLLRTRHRTSTMKDMVAGSVPPLACACGKAAASIHYTHTPAAEAKNDEND